MTGRTCERVRLVRLDAFGGVEAMHASYVTQTFSRHTHERYAVGCIEAGAMGFRYLGAGHVAAAGQVNLVVPGEVHDGHAAIPAGWRYRMFYLPPETLDEAAKGLCGAAGEPRFTQGVIDDPDLAAWLRATHAAVMDPGIGALEKQTRLLGLVAAWVRRHAEAGGEPRTPRPENRAAALARDYLLAHLAEDPGLDDVAAASGLSPFHMLRVFRARFGLPPHAWLTQERLRRARSLLAGPLRLADIAQDTGFADQAHLTRRFKRQYGLTPGRYRKIVQNT